MDRTTQARRNAERRRTALLAASAIALVFAAAPERAMAQFAGSGEVKAGGAEIGGSTVNVLGPRTVIDWSPTDTSGPAVIDFLPNGNTVNYRSDLTDYTVLNRILPTTTSMIGLNGAITSTVYDGGEGQTAGGNVWFYTPYGFVIGNGASISVGGLVLTTNDIAYGLDGNNGAIFTDANGAVKFAGAAGSKAPIIVSPGASIIGNNAGSYIALVAPRIEQHGYVQADRSIAYVAAEAADITINAGNFDIAITTGTTDGEAIVHDGTTTGSASTGFSDSKAISFIAIPKNDALTMMLGGSVGYAAASSVFNDGASIVLTAGEATGPDGNIRIGAGQFTSRVGASATGSLTVAPEPPGPNSEGTSDTVFRSFADLSANKSVDVLAAGGTRVQADIGLSLRAGTDAGAGSISIEAQSGLIDGEITINGFLDANVSHTGGTSEDGTTGLDGQGGTIELTANGGTIYADYMYLSAQGYGGIGTIQGGNGRGGSIAIVAGQGGTITSASVGAYARGEGGPGYDFSGQVFTPGFGGVGRGGSVTVADSIGTPINDPSGGRIGIDYLYLDASAIGGNSASFGSGMGGDAFGGSIDLVFDRQNQDLSTIQFDVSARDGDSAVDPVGGDITMTVGGGISVNLDNLYASAGAYSGINGPVGAFARGGTIKIEAIENASLSVLYLMDLSARADTISFFGDTPDSTADLTGGDITVSADSGTIDAAFIDVDAGAYNYGAATRAGFAHGGTITVTAANGGTVGTREQDTEGTPSFRLEAEAYSGAGDAVGESRGGTITLSALSGGAIVAPFIAIELEASGETGVVSEGGANGADAFGGTINIDAIGGSIGAPLVAIANGEGGEADNRAGSGTGGTIAVRVLENGALGGEISASASGSGGQSLVSGDGGDGTGGHFSMLTDASASLLAFGLGFDGTGTGGTAIEGVGGDGYGGTAQIDIIGGKHDWSYANLNAYAEGAQSQGADSLSGSAFGDIDGLQFHVGGEASLSIRGAITLRATAYTGGNGGANQAIGGSAGVLVDGGAALNASSIRLDTSGFFAGFSYDPLATDTTPAAQGGTASVVADGGAITAAEISAIADGDTAAALVSAGTATGGTAIVGAANGGSITLSGFSEFTGLEVHANGGGAEGPSAAHAFGGSATIFANGGSIVSPYSLSVEADAGSGDYAGYYTEFSTPSNGFDATGGTATIEMAGPGGLIDLPSAAVSAQGRADYFVSGGNGGVGTGGTALLDIAGGTFTVGDSLSIRASGHGGYAGASAVGADAFASGDGNGGMATFLLSGGTATVPSLSIDASGFGAYSNSGNPDETLAYAGHGYGGSATLSASGGTLDNTGYGVESGFSISADGYGGGGAYNPSATGAGGAGGFGAGGSALFEAPAGSTASLAIGGSINVNANGFGGYAGGSASGTYGPGGDGFGGDALVALADIPFAFGDVYISGSGFGGPAGSFGQAFSFVPGQVGSGTGNGGTAGFELVDSGAITADRSISRLNVTARGTDYTGTLPNGDGGATSFVAEVGGAGAALSITGDLLLDASGAAAPAGNGFTGSIGGASVTVGGTATILTPRDAVLAITSPAALDVTGDLTITVGRAFASTGPISTLGDASVIADLGIDMTHLSAAGTTLLRALNGPVSVSTNLRSGGLVTVYGTTVNLKSLGALSFADADAIAGSLTIETEGDLELATVDAAGAVTLISNGGTVHNTGAVNGTDLTFIAGIDVISDTAIAANGNLTVDAGGIFSTPDGSASATGNVNLSADLGLDLASVVSGGTTLLRADQGNLAVGSLTSAGAVTASGQDVSIVSPGALTFTSADATAGNLFVRTAGNLALGGASASGDIALTSIGGSLTGTGPVVAGGGIMANGQTGIAFGTLTSGATTDLFAVSGPVIVTNLNSTGVVSVEGTAIDIGSTGALTFAELEATAGNVRVQTADILGVGAVTATGSITLISTGGALAASGALNGVGITLSSFANLTLANALATSGAISLTSTNGAVSAASPVNAGGALAVSGLTGVTLGSASSGGTTTLTATNGAIAITNLASVGAVTASGRSVTIGSTGALTFADLDATAGNVAVQTGGNLSVNTVDATGSVTLTSTNGAVSALSPVNALGVLAVSGLTGVTLGSASSGGTTTLTAADGAVQVNNLASVGAVTASGRSVTIGSTGALTFADLDATSGDIAVQAAGNLAVNTVDATGAVTLTSTGGALSVGGAINGNGIALTSLANLSLGNALATTGALGLTSTGGSVIATSLLSAGGNLAVSGLNGVSLGTATSGGTTSLDATNGAIAVADLNSAGPVTASGRSINIGSTGALAVASAQATAGNLSISTAQGMSVGIATASGTLGLSAGGALSTTGAVSGAGVTLSGASITTGGTVTSSGALALTAQQLLTVNAAATGTAITATAGDIAIGSGGRLGTRGSTQTLRIGNQSASAPINLGGAGTSGQFSLDQTEAARLFADQTIAIVGRASEGGGAPITIGTLAMSFGTASTANIGSGGMLKVDTAGLVTVNGAVTLSTSSAADTFSIDPTRINVVAGPGSISLLGTAGTPLGTLVLEGGTIAVADQSVLDAIGSNAEFAALKTMLDRPTATPSDTGFIRAGSIDVTATDGLFIQNTGTSTASTARRGFTASAFNIDTGSASTKIAINGVILGATGTLTGRLAIDAITINGQAAARGGSFDPLSTINGCLIGSSCGASGAPTRSDLETPVGVDDVTGPGQAGTLIELSENEPLITPPLVDEPITGVGNDDLWQVHCDPEEGKAGCPTGKGEDDE